LEYRNKIKDFYIPWKRW